MTSPTRYERIAFVASAGAEAQAIRALYAMLKARYA